MTFLNQGMSVALGNIAPALDGVYWWLGPGPKGAELQRGGLTLRRC